MSEPIASYSDAAFPWKRKTILYHDRIEIMSRDFFSSDHQATVPLSLLSDRIDRTFFRTQVFTGGFTLLLIGLVGAGFAYLGPSFSTLPRPYSIPELFAFCIPIIALAMMLRTVRKVEAVHFVGANGFSHVNLCRCGPDRARFDEFVAQVREAVHQQHAQAPVASQIQAS